MVLVLLINAMVFKRAWVFGVLIMAWTIADMVAGRVHFMDAIFKAENPILFWVIAVLWLSLGLYFLLQPLVSPLFS